MKNYRLCVWLRYWIFGKQEDITSDTYNIRNIRRFKYIPIIISQRPLYSSIMHHMVINKCSVTTRALWWTLFVYWSCVCCGTRRRSTKNCDFFKVFNTRTKKRNFLFEKDIGVITIERIEWKSGLRETKGAGLFFF